MVFQRSNADPSLFLIAAQEKLTGVSELVGTMGLYVDDFLLAGTMTVSREALEQIRKEWKTSAPEFCGPGCGDGFLKFLGLQIWYRNGAFFLSQEDFVWDLLHRRGYQIDESGKGSHLPMVKETPGEEEEVAILSLRAAQGAVGEFLWVAINTIARPDLADFHLQSSNIDCPCYHCIILTFHRPNEGIRPPLMQVSSYIAL